MAIKWTKDDVIKKFREALTEGLTPKQPKVAQGPEALQNLLGKIQRKPVEGEETV